MSTKIYTIKVTDEHIEKGIRLSSEKCAVALALNRVFPDRPIDVTGKIYISGYEVDAPQCVTSFISDFDDGWAVSPFKFKLAIDLNA